MAAGSAALSDVCGHCDEKASAGDKYCRRCGRTLLLSCSNCDRGMRIADKWCAHCGTKRGVMEHWRFEARQFLDRPATKVGLTIAVAAAWAALYYALRKRL